MEQKTRVQHYVPRFYLKNFTFNDKQVFVYNKNEEKSFTANIYHLAYDNFFYDLPEEQAKQAGIDPQIVEKTLAGMEGNWNSLLGTIIKTIEDNKRIVIDETQRQDLAHFVTVQYLRTKENRLVQAEMVRKLGETLLSKDYSEKSEDYKVEVNNRFISSMQIGRMFDSNIELYIDTLKSHIWVIGVNNTDIPLFTSDDPIVLKPYKHSPYKSYVGLGAEGIEIAFPLTPKYILLLREKTFHNRLANKNNRTITLTKSEVRKYNELQISQSTRQEYSQKDNSDFVKDILTRHPDFRDPNRPRVIVT